jgi:hypothetical protein
LEKVSWLTEHHLNSRCVGDNGPMCSSHIFGGVGKKCGVRGFPGGRVARQVAMPPVSSKALGGSGQLVGTSHEFVGVTSHACSEMEVLS